MQYGLGVAHGGVDAERSGQAIGSIKYRAGPGAAKLDQVSALTVAVAGGTFGIDRDGSLALRQAGGDLG